MFEKSLYDLIRGLRNHKGREQTYIADSIKECRSEIRSQDMDLKSTALLKLTYLEMFGYDMSWASFNVLEVMSSPKYRHKRTGYLAAVQSFRRDTEVLMLAENQLKKDVSSVTPTVVALALTAIPHVVNPSMANSILGDLLSRLTHSHAAIRKKTVVTLYRLALVYPETLRPAWPKIKERLLDDNEDPSVTAAIINVICELGWRRPQDFLPLAPRLFELMIEPGNNWMVIKLIKLFATLTPLEPRLTKKLLPPLTRIIKETTATSLLYECINGIIQGGILEAVEGTAEGEEVAKLCVGKLRGMMLVAGDSNLKYVALLAFEKIVRSHPHLVWQQQDVILESIDDPDISIRMCALDLVVGMVNSDNLTAIVGRLMRQLRNAPTASTADDPANDRGHHGGVIPIGEDDDSEAEESLRRAEQKSNQPPPLPEDYRITMIKRILEMCSRDTYSNLTDFDWYIDVLVQLVRVSPATSQRLAIDETDEADSDLSDDVGRGIGKELQNVAVRVKSVRPEAVDAAQSLILVDQRDKMFPASGNGGQSVLEYAGWMVGEYASLLNRPDAVMTSLLHSSSAQLPARTLAVFLQAIPKVFASMAGNEQISWTPERKSLITLLMARIINFLEPLATHPSLEVQERAVEYLELMRLAAEAAAGTASGDGHGDFTDPPLLLTQAIPALFSGAELNPVAPGAQRKVPIPNDLDLDAPINPNLQSLLQQAEYETFSEEEDDVYAAYNEPPVAYTEPHLTAAERIDAQKSENQSTSYQNAPAVEEEYLDPDILARRKAERRERYKDDPFYIDPDREKGDRSGTGTPLGNIIKSDNGEEVDIDSIPVMDLDLSGAAAGPRGPGAADVAPRRSKPRRRVEIIGDETLGPAESSSSSRDSSTRPGLPGTLSSNSASVSKQRKSLLEVDSSGLGMLSLDDESGTAKRNREVSRLEFERKAAEQREMELALREVERKRLELQRASEARLVHGGEGEKVVRRKKKSRRVVGIEGEGDNGGVKEGDEAGKIVKKKKKKKVKDGDGGHADAAADANQAAGGSARDCQEVDVAPKKKKKKRRVVGFDDEPPVVET